MVVNGSGGGEVWGIQRHSNGDVSIDDVVVGGEEKVGMCVVNVCSKEKLCGCGVWYKVVDAAATFMAMADDEGFGGM